MGILYNPFDFGGVIMSFESYNQFYSGGDCGTTIRVGGKRASFSFFCRTKKRIENTVCSPQAKQSNAIGGRTSPTDLSNIARSPMRWTHSTRFVSVTA